MLLKKYLEERKSKQFVIDKINEEIEKYEESGDSVEELIELHEKKRRVKLNGIETGEVLKVVANVAIVIVIVGFEMSHIMNQKASRFIKTL